MPELPEVETIRCMIKSEIVNCKIEKIKINKDKIIAHHSVEEFCQGVEKRVITDIRRRGKFLKIILDNESTMVVHLRMTGKLLVTPREMLVEKHTHVIILLSNNKELRYLDTRSFGRFWLIKKDEEDIFTGMNKLGIEPFDFKLNADYLKDKIGKRNKPIKEMLHDQSIVTGIGNIYSDEILFYSRIYPAKRCKDLNDEEWRKIAEAIPIIINWGLEIDKTTPERFLSERNEGYTKIEYLKAYGHEGEPCPNCGTIFKRIIIYGRSSCYCSNCQKENY